MTLIRLCLFCFCLAGLTAAQSFSPGSLSFGAEVVGTASDPQVITLANSTGQALINIHLRAGGDFYLTTTCGTVLLAGDSCTIAVTFIPVTTGTQTATLQIDSASGQGPQTVQLSGTGTPPQIFGSSALDFGLQPVGAGNTKSIQVTNSTPWTLFNVQFSINGNNRDEFYPTTTCRTVLNPGARCSLSVLFQPSSFGQQTALITFSSHIPGVTQTLTITGAGALDFGEQKVVGRSLIQTTTYTNPAGATANIAITITGANSGDFMQANNCGNTMAAGASCSINLVFAPLLIGNRSATLSITNSADGSQKSIPLTGTSVVTGVFEIVNALTGKVLEVAGGSGSNGAAIQQSGLNGQARQQWQFISDGEYYKITNTATGKVLDVTDVSTANGARIQQWDYLGGANQQWQLVPVDDVHYKIVNALSGKVLDVTDASGAGGTRIQQWDYMGNPQQLWVLMQAGSYNITNLQSKKMLDVTNASLANTTLIQQWAPNGREQQDWQLLPVGGDYYAILNLMSGKVLDVIGAAAANGTQIQQYDYWAGENQQWQLIPTYVSGGLAYQIKNRLSGKVLDDTDLSISNGTKMQQWDYLGGVNQLWEISPIVVYNVMNRYSGLVLDVIDGSTVNGARIQQWAAMSDGQQEWQLVDTGDGYYALINKLTGKALDVAGGSASNGIVIQQWDYSGNANQQWQLVSAGDGYYRILNRQSGKALDVTDWSTSNGALIQQWDYLGGPNQQWQLAPAFN